MLVSSVSDAPSDLGPFAMKLGLGLWPALFSLAMMLTYSIVMGAVFGMIDARPDRGGSTD
jgi:hypothetical protein